MANLVQRIPYFARQMVDEAGTQAVYLQILILILMGFRAAFAIISLTQLALLQVLWNLIILCILLVGFISARSRNQLLLLCYVAVIGAVMVLSLIDFLISIVTNLFKLSIAWQIVYVIFTSIHLILEAGSVLQAWKVYRLLLTGHRLPQAHIVLPADGVPEPTYVPGGDAELGYELKERPQGASEESFEGEGQPPATAYPPVIGSTPYGLAPSFTPAAYAGQPPPQSAVLGPAVVTDTSALYPITYDNQPSRT